jgi:predicted phosphodiesterase
VLGDVHGDVAALRRVVARLGRARPDRVVCLGDVLDCGAAERAAGDADRPFAEVTDWDAELADLLAGAELLRGNQEERVAELVGAGGVPEECHRLLRAPRRWAAGDVEVVHGHELSWTRVRDDWYCPLDAPVRRVLLFGHHHRNALYRVGGERTWAALERPALRAGAPQRLGGPALVNVGPVLGAASWVLLDTEADTITHHFEPSYAR